MDDGQRVRALVAALKFTLLERQAVDEIASIIVEDVMRQEHGAR